MTELVTRNYWWLGVTKNVEKHVKRCDLCQRMKNRTEIPVEKLMTNKVLEKLQIHLIVDFITKLLLVVEKNVILVIYDRLPKMVYFMATTKGILAKGLVRLFRDNV